MHGLRHSLQRPLVSAAMSPIRLSSVTRQLSALLLISSCRRFVSTFIIASALPLISKSFDACPLGPSLDPSNIHLAISGFARQELKSCPLLAPSFFMLHSSALPWPLLALQYVSVGSRKPLLFSPLSRKRLTHIRPELNQLSVLKATLLYASSCAFEI
ncbi:hypothetical protein E4T42_03337 [Aureobasidium subglaciale]|nr:hypothetical protein E4T42_03337 [Aureobasidium subglaciale]